MKNLTRVKRWLNPFLTLRKSEQRGIVLLVILITLLFVSRLLLPFLFKRDDLKDPGFERAASRFIRQYQQMEDSLKVTEMQNSGQLTAELARHRLKPIPFDPNTLSKEGWVKMGLTEKQAATIQRYLAKGGQFRNKEDLAKIYCISEGEYALLAPYVAIDRAPGTEEKYGRGKAPGKRDNFRPVELNTADSAQLVSDLGFAPWVAARIVNYRALLGGYHEQRQLFEVYGMDSQQARQRFSYVTIDTTLVSRLNLNTGTFRQLLRHPYISYDLTKLIVNRRRTEGSFNSVHELLSLGWLSGEEYNKLRPYLHTE